MKREPKGARLAFAAGWRPAKGQQLRHPGAVWATEHVQTGAIYRTPEMDSGRPMPRPKGVGHGN